MDYISTFVESFTGMWLDENNLRAIPHLLFKKCLGFFLLLIGGILFAILIAYLNHFYDITGFYLFFIIPVGAIILGLVANIGFVATLSFLRTRGINYSMLFLIVMSGLIALFTFWLSQYIVYSTGTITINHVSRVPPSELKQAKSELKQMESTLHNLRASIENFSKEIQSIKSRINQMEYNAELGLFVDQEEYKRVISRYNSLVSNYNTNVKTEQKLYNRYETKLIEVNALIDKFNRGEIGKEITEMKKEPISKNYAFLDYIKKTYEKRSFRMFGLVGKVPLVTPSADIKMGSFGIILLILKQIGLFALPVLWLLTNRL